MNPVILAPNVYKILQDSGNESDSRIRALKAVYLQGVYMLQGGILFGEWEPAWNEKQLRLREKADEVIRGYSLQP